MRRFEIALQEFRELLAPVPDAQAIAMLKPQRSGVDAVKQFVAWAVLGSLWWGTWVSHKQRYLVVDDNTLHVLVYADEELVTHTRTSLAGIQDVRADVDDLAVRLTLRERGEEKMFVLVRFLLDRDGSYSTEPRILEAVSAMAAALPEMLAAGPAMPRRDSGPSA